MGEENKSFALKNVLAVSYKVTHLTYDLAILFQVLSREIKASTHKENGTTLVGILRRCAYTRQN